MGEWNLTILEYHGHGKVDILSSNREPDPQPEPTENEGDNRWIAGLIGVAFLIAVAIGIRYWSQRSSDDSDFEQVTVTEYED